VAIGQDNDKLYEHWLLLLGLPMRDEYAAQLPSSTSPHHSGHLTARWLTGMDASAFHLQNPLRPGDKEWARQEWSAA